MRRRRRGVGGRVLGVQPEFVEPSHARRRIEDRIDAPLGQQSYHAFELRPSGQPGPAQHQADRFVADGVREVVAILDRFADHPGAQHSGCTVELVKSLYKIAHWSWGRAFIGDWTPTALLDLVGNFRHASADRQIVHATGPVNDRQVLPEIAQDRLSGRTRPHAGRSRMGRSSTAAGGNCHGRVARADSLCGRRHGCGAGARVVVGAGAPAAAGPRTTPS